MSLWRCVVAAVLTACAPTASVRVRDLPLPASFGAPSSGPSAGALDWRQFFEDENLHALIDEALANNRDLQVVLQRIEIARVSIRAATGRLLPQVSAYAGAGVTRFGRYTLDGSGALTTDITPGRITPNPVGELSLGVQASWEADVWGALRSLRGSARAQYLATVEGTNLVVTTLIADVAATYFELLALDHVRDIFRETIGRQAQAIEMIRAQKDAGRANELAVQQFEAQVATTRAMDAAAIVQIRERENRLNVLLGRLPQAIPRVKEQLRRNVATTMATGVPSELLRNRPDIRQAEHQVEAARFDVAAARAAFYPSVSITATAGYSAFNPKYLLSTPDSIVASLAGGLLAPLVNRRGIEAEFAAAQAGQIQAMYQYQSVVLVGFAEVATGLSALEQSVEIVTQRKHKQAAVAGAVEAADALFRAGKASYLEVLLAQQNTLDAELELIEALRDQHIVSIGLYRALGGGWRGALQVSTRTAAKK